MLDLVERYWQWKKYRNSTKFKTVHGYIVHKFAQQYAVVKYKSKSTNEYQYIDLDCSDTSSWPCSKSWYFTNRCLANLDKIEARFGKLIPITDEEEDNHYARPSK